MKTITFFKRVLASAALVSVCGFACATNNGKQFIHNDTMEGGKLVCREIYAMNDAASGILNPVKMYKYRPKHRWSILYGIKKKDHSIYQKNIYT